MGLHRPYTVSYTHLDVYKRQGYTSRFGLTHVDYETQQRIFKDSAYFYQEVIRQNKLLETL